MKNIQVIDGARNCVYDIFGATEREFALLFPDNTDVAFIDEIYARGDEQQLNATLSRIWGRPIKKAEVRGIHGIIFYDLEEKKPFYPTRKDEEAINPNGSKLR